MRRTTDGTTNVVCDGNSLTLGTGGTAYPTQLDALCSAAVSTTNLGVGGQTATQMSADYLTQVRPLASPRAARNILLVWEVRNAVDIDGSTPRAAVDALWTYVDRAVLSGWEVWVCTVIASVEIRNITDAKIAEANGYIRAEAAAHGCRVIDLAADVRLSDDLDPTYYVANEGAGATPGGIHLLTAGYAVVAELVFAATALPAA